MKKPLSQKAKKQRKPDSSAEEDDEEEEEDDDEDDEEDTPKRQTRRRGATKVKRCRSNVLKTPFCSGVFKDKIGQDVWIFAPKGFDVMQLI